MAKKMAGRATADELTAALAAATNDMQSDEAKAALAGMAEADLRKALAFVRANEAENPLAEWSFEISGSPPVAKRPRSTRMGGRPFAPDADDKLILGQLIRVKIPDGFVPVAGEVELGITVYKAIPEGFPAYKKLLAEAGYVRPEKKPDWDNYGKIICDAMTQRMFKDDGQCVIGMVAKLYSSRPRLEVKVYARRKAMS